MNALSVITFNMHCIYFLISDFLKTSLKIKPYIIILKMSTELANEPIPIQKKTKEVDPLMEFGRTSIKEPLLVLENLLPLVNIAILSGRAVMFQNLKSISPITVKGHRQGLLENIWPR